MENLIIQYWYLIIFPLVVIEWPIVTIISWYLSSIWLINIFWAFLIILGADALSDLLHYLLWYYGGNKLVEKYGWFLWFSAEKAEKMSKTIHANKVKTIFGKMIYGIWWVPVVACGLAKIPLWEFFSISIFVSAIQISIYMSIWYFLWEFYNKILKYLEYGGYIFGILALAILWIYIYLNRKK